MHAAAMSGTSELRSLRVIWNTPVIARAGTNHLDLLHMASIACYESIIEHDQPPTHDRIAGLVWLMTQVVDVIGAAPAWEVLWESTPALAVLLLRTAASMYCPEDVLFGVRRNGHIDLVEIAYGKSDDVKNAIESMCMLYAHRALDNTDYDLMARAISHMDNLDAAGFAEMFLERKCADVQMLETCYPALARSDIHVRRSIATLFVDEKNGRGMDVALHLFMELPPPTLPPSPPRCIDDIDRCREVLMTLIKRANATRSWDCYGWLMHFAQMRGFLRIASS